MPKSTLRPCYRRGLPHYQAPGHWYHLTFSLRLGVHLSPVERGIVLEACRYHDVRSWKLGACCVMPTLGTHVLAMPGDAARPLERILHSIKSYSAHRINVLGNRSGILWERETFDRTIRCSADLADTLKYIVNNPVAAGLVVNHCDYRWLYVAPEFLDSAWTAEFGRML